MCDSSEIYIQTPRKTMEDLWKPMEDLWKTAKIGKRFAKPQKVSKVTQDASFASHWGAFRFWRGSDGILRAEVTQLSKHTAESEEHMQIMAHSFNMCQHVLALDFAKHFSRIQNLANRRRIQHRDYRQSCRWSRSRAIFEGKGWFCFELVTTLDIWKGLSS